MKNSNRSSFGAVKALLVSAAILLPAASVMADTIYTVTADKNKPFPRPGVTITKIDKTDDGEVLRYTTSSGDVGNRKIEDVVQIEAEGETAFNQAEAEFFKGDLQAASDDYSKAISSSTKEWVKHRADVRLLYISGKLGNFVGAVKGFVELAKKDPASAASRKPTLPANSSQLSSAIAAINSGMGGATVETKRVVLPFLVELYNKNDDTPNATKVLAILKGMGPTKNDGQTGLPDEVGGDILAQKQAEADTALTKANAAFEAHDYEKAIAAINAVSASFVDPDRQSKALYLIAESKAATATTPTAMEEAALAYMRVVAHFKSLPGGLAADALYKTGVIEEKLNKIAEARSIYGQIVNEFRDSKAAGDAQAALARLK